jgi:hypothetical protein
MDRSAIPPLVQFGHIHAQTMPNFRPQVTPPVHAKDFKIMVKNKLTMMKMS